MLRFFRRKYILLALGVLVLTFLALAVGLILYVQSPAFTALARRYVAREISSRTGATVQLEGFEWSLLRRRFELDNLTIRGREPDSEEPLARFPKIEIGLNLRTLFQRKVNLFELTLTNPALHIVIDSDGKTNFPTPPVKDESKPLNLEIAIENFRFVQGTALLRELQIDTDFVVTDLASEMSYHSTTGILNSHIRFAGQYARFHDPTIPYTFDAEMDFTRGTLLPHRINLQSGASQLKLQGRIDDLLNNGITGRLAYTGTVEVPFLKYFFPTEDFSGNADVAGFMEFSGGYFSTTGNTASDAIVYSGWRANELTTEYSYQYPNRRATFKNIRAKIAGGRTSGSFTIENVPGEARMLVDLDYTGIDGDALARMYPWPATYHIHSNVTGSLHGWFQGKFERYAISGKAALTSYARQAATGIVPLALDGSTDYALVPGQARVTKADLRLGSTHVLASGLIDQRNSDLTFAMDSSDLRDGYFIYSDANGTGTFDGTLRGPIQNPVFDGNFTLQHYVYQGKWSFENATGHLTLPTATEMAVLDNVHVKQGHSEIVLNGSTSLTGSAGDLAIRVVQVQGDDLHSFINRKIGGMITGSMRLTSFNPVKVEGDLRADNLQIDDKVVGNTRGHIRYFEPSVDLSSLSIERNGSSLTGNVSFNRTSEALKFSARISSVDLDSIRWVGLPDGLTGVVVEANVQGDGTLKQPVIQGTGTIRNLSYETETFPEVHVNVTSAGPTVNATLETGSNVNATVQIKTDTNTYPFTAKATFTQYPLEKAAGLSQGTLSASGTATISGLLTDRKAFHGEGQVESAQAEVQGKTFRTTTPFTFDFNNDRLALSNVTVAGAGTQGTISGTIGLTKVAALNLDVRGGFDLALLAAAKADWTVSGSVNVDGRIRGNRLNPDLRGTAHIANASISNAALLTSLTDLNGDLAFDENRVTVNNMKGQVGGGTVTVQGGAVLREDKIQSLNIRIDTNSVRIRYPEGLRSVIDGALTLRGSWDSPLLEGDIKIQSMAYRSGFEDFVNLLGTAGTGPTQTPLDRLRLAIHVSGGRNITIENELANVQARVDVDVRGTVGKPALTGHVEASGGTLSFQGKKYTITRGNVDFVDPLKIEPVVDVQAETDIREYRVILAVSGKGDHLRVETRSDPPLPQIEVINLIA